MSRRFQFSLRALLVIMVVVSAWMAILSSRARTQRDIVDMILKKGGGVHYRHQEFIARRGWNDAEPIAPRWLRHALGDDYFQTVSLVALRGFKFSDKELEVISNLKGVRVLTVNEECYDITAAGLRGLQTRLPSCEIISGIKF
jgi:hypothetical protein